MQTILVPLQLNPNILDDLFISYLPISIQTFLIPHEALDNWENAAFELHQLHSERFYLFGCLFGVGDDVDGVWFEFGGQGVEGIYEKKLHSK